LQAVHFFNLMLSHSAMPQEAQDIIITIIMSAVSESALIIHTPEPCNSAG